MRDLTPRARAFIVSGLVAVVCGMLFGERDFVRIGMLLVACPLIALLFVRRGARAVTVTRQNAQHRVEAGGSVPVRLTLRAASPDGGTARGGIGVPLLVEDRLPADLGPAVRFVIERLPAGSSRELSYALPVHRRGRYRLGPTVIHLSEAFGMVDRTWEVPTSATVLVTPRVEQLPVIPLVGSWATSGDTQARDFVTGGVADVTIREYRQGDDVRLVHWPSTARVGELMVRQEEQPLQSRATVFLDDRAAVHHGRGADSSLETGIVAAASVVCHLAAQGFQVRLVTAEGAQVSGWHEGMAASDVSAHLEHLALTRPSNVERLSHGWFAEEHRGAMIVAVLGLLDEPDREVLARLATTGTRAHAIALDVEHWGRRATEEPVGPAPSTTTSATWLRGHGWRAAPLVQGEAVASAWRGLTR